MRRRLRVPNVARVKPVDLDRFNLAGDILDVNEVVYEPDGVIQDNIDGNSVAHPALDNGGTYTERTLVENIAAGRSSHDRGDGRGSGWHREERC